MAAAKENLSCIANGGSIADATYGSVTHKVFHFITNDTATAVETDGYFDALYYAFTEGKGDIILASLDRDGTLATKTYVVTRTGTDIALTAEVDAT